MSGSLMEDNFTNITEFSCVNTGMLSSDYVSDENFWRITGEQEVGAIIAGVLILLFFLVGTVWNLFIIITFLVKHHLLKEPGNIFLFNAAITDLLICLTTMVFTFVTAFGKEFIFGNDDVSRCILCSTSGFFLMFLILVSLHLLAALSIDRFILLSKPLRYKRIMNRWKAGVICFICYAICFVLAGLPIIGFGDIEFNARFASCVPRFTPTKNLYYCGLIVVEALIPIIILAITNVWTFRIVSKFLKRNFRRRSTYRRRDAGGNTKEVDEGAKYQRQQNQLVKVFGALFIANIISYTPTITAVILFAFLSIIGKENVIPAAIYILGYVSFLMNPVLHPIIESFFVKDLRYQVTRAKKGIRRASTIIYRQTTGHLTSKALDEANRKFEQSIALSQTQMTSCGPENMELLNGQVSNGSMEGSTPPQKEATDLITENNLTLAASSQTPSPNLVRKQRKSVTFKEERGKSKDIVRVKQSIPPTFRTLGQDPTLLSSLDNHTIQEEDGAEILESPPYDTLNDNINSSEETHSNNASPASVF